jgi:hypothetical protein
MFSTTAMKVGVDSRNGRETFQIIKKATLA